MNDPKQNQNNNRQNGGFNQNQKPFPQNNQPRKDNGQQNRPFAAAADTYGEPTGQKYVSIAIIAFLLGFGAAALWFGDSTDGSANSSSTATSTATSTAMVETKGAETKTPTPATKEPKKEDVTTPTTNPPVMTTSPITVNDQKAGVSVTVASVTLGEPAWLAVTESVEGGVRILGAQLFDKGVHEGKTIELLRGTLPGQSYRIVIRSDNGDHAFDPKVDSPLVVNGTEVSAPFIAL